MSFKPSVLRVLRLLQAHQPHAVHATMAGPLGMTGEAFRKRISELREGGIAIRTEDVIGRNHKAYRILGNPATF